MPKPSVFALRPIEPVVRFATGGTGVAGTEGDDDYSAYEQDPDSGEWVTSVEMARRRAAKAQAANAANIAALPAGQWDATQAAAAKAQSAWGGALANTDRNLKAIDQYTAEQPPTIMAKPPLFEDSKRSYSGVQEEKKPDSTLDTILGALKGGANSIVENLPQGQFGNRAARPGEATVQGSSLGEIAPKALAIPDALNPELPNGVGPFIENKVRPFVSDTIQNMRGLNNGAAGYGLGEEQGPKVVPAPVANAIADQIPSRAADTAMLLAPLAGKAVEAAKGLDVAGDLSGAAYRSGIGGGGKFEQEIKAAVDREAAAKAATGATGDATAAAVAEPPPIVQSPVQKLSEALKSAEKATPEQQAMFDQQRSQRTAMAASALDRGTGTNAFKSARGALSGEFDRPSFKLPDIAPEDVQALHETIRTSPKLQVYDKINAQSALDDLFGGRIPEPSRLKSLVSAFDGDRDFIQSIGDTIRKAAPPGLQDYSGELWMNSVLSNPLSHARNFIGNMSSALTSPVERLASAGTEQVLARVQGRAAERFLAEVPANVVGMVKGIPEGVSAALDVFRYGFNPTEVARADLGQSAFKGWLGRVIRTPTNAMEAADQFFYAINYRGDLNASAVRMAKSEGLSGSRLSARAGALMDSPTPAMIKASANAAEYRLFRAPAGSVTQSIIGLRNQVPGLKYIVPFVRTPVNLAKFGIERSPLGFLDPALWHNLAAKSPEAADQIGKAAMGSTIAAAFATAVATGKVDITAGVPAQAAARDRFFREGKLPFAIKIGDHWIQYSQLQPLNETLTTIGAAVDAIRNGQDPSAAAIQTVTTIGQNLADQTYMTGLSNLMNAIQDPGRYGSTLAEHTATGFIPFSGALRFAATTMDDTVRQPKGLLETAKSGIPGLSEQVPARQTAFGEDAPRQSPVYSPIQVTADQTSAVDAELGRLGVEIGFVGPKVGNISLDRDQHQLYQQMAGQRTYAALAAMVQDPRWATLSATDQQKAIEQRRDFARNSVRDPIGTLTDSDLWKSRSPEQQQALLNELLQRLESGWHPQ